jgi:hypothetical protein
MAKSGQTDEQRKRKFAESLTSNSDISTDDQLIAREQFASHLDRKNTMSQLQSSDLASYAGTRNTDRDREVAAANATAERNLIGVTSEEDLAFTNDSYRKVGDAVATYASKGLEQEDSPGWKGYFTKEQVTDTLSNAVSSFKADKVASAAKADPSKPALTFDERDDQAFEHILNIIADESTANTASVEDTDINRKDIEKGLNKYWPRWLRQKANDAKRAEVEEARIAAVSKSEDDASIAITGFGNNLRAGSAGTSNAVQALRRSRRVGPQ